MSRRRGLRIGSFVAGVLALSVLAVSALAATAARRPDLAWEMVAQDAPVVLWAGRNHDVTITVANRGTASWSESSGDHLGYHWRRTDGAVVEWDGRRGVLPAAVPPGERAAVVVRVRAPGQAGRYVLEWEMVREQVGWYGPPVAGRERARQRVFVVHRAALLQSGFLVLTLGSVLAARRLWRVAGVPAWASLVLPAWTWAGAALVVVTFSEAAGTQLWRGGGVLAAASAALPAALVALFPPRARAWSAALAVAALSGLGIADVVYFRFFRTLIPPVAAGAVGQLGEIGGSVRALLLGRDLAFVPAIVAAIVLAAGWPRAARAAGPARRRLAWFVPPVVLILAAVPALRALATALEDPRTADQVFSQEALLGRWGFLNVHLFDAARGVREWRASRGVGEVERGELASWLAMRHEPGAATLPQFGLARGRNLVLVQVESLQQWVVDAAVGGRPVMPFVASLGRRALVFPRVSDQTGQGRSSDAEFIALNSLHALDRGAVAFRRPDNRFVALPAVLRRAGYATLSAHGFERGFWNRAVLHPRWGFDRMLFRDELRPGESIGWGLADGPFLQQVASELTRTRPPFFAFCITLGLHHPFDQFPDRHRTLDVGGLDRTPLGNYLQAMHYFDAQLEAFVAALEASGLAATTVVALYGDHEAGLALDDRLLGLAGVGRRGAATEVLLRRVPFVVLLPGGGLRGEVAVTGGQIDIAPTLLALLGVVAPASFAGSPLAPAGGRVAVLNDASVVSDEAVFVARGDGVPDGGACLALPSLAPRPAAACADLAARGRDELARTRRIVLADLAAELAGRASP